MGACAPASSTTPAPSRRETDKTFLRASGRPGIAEFVEFGKRSLTRIDSAVGLAIHFRIGIHCDPVIAVVIDTKKFIYDIWGDTVNTAARLRGLALPVEARSFRPHVTIARRAGLATPPASGPGLRWKVRDYALVESRPSAQGAYTVLRTWP